MRFGLYFPIFNDFHDPTVLVDLAVRAEAAGFDGFFIWDHLAIVPDGSLALTDATVTLGAIAQATSSILFGPMITPLARRRPGKVAREVAALDQLSNGRVIFGVGIGELRTNYAGFFDSGFGGDGGTRAVLEVRPHDVPFLVEDGQVFFKLQFFRTVEEPEVCYGDRGLDSHYQGQGLKLSKHFKQL